MTLTLAVVAGVFLLAVVVAFAYSMSLAKAEVRRLRATVDTYRRIDKLERKATKKMRKQARR